MPLSDAACLCAWPQSQRLIKLLNCDEPKLDHCYTRPGIKCTEQLDDPVARSAEHLLGKTLSRPAVSVDEHGLQTLIKQGHLRAAVNLTTTLLITMQQGTSNSAQPSRNTVLSLKIWAYRFQLLMALKMYALLNDELLPFEELDAPDLFLEYYRDMQPAFEGGSFSKSDRVVQGSMVPFSMRLVHAEALRFTPLPWTATQRIDTLERNVQQVMLRLNERQTHLWRGRLMAVRQMRARTLFLLKEYSSSLNVYRGLAMQQHDPVQRRAIHLLLSRMALSLGSESEAEKSCVHNDPFIKALRCIFHGNYSQAFDLLHSVAQQDTKVINNKAVCLLYMAQPRDAFQLLADSTQPNQPMCINLVNIAELATCQLNQLKRDVLVSNVDRFADMFDPAVLKLSSQ